MGYVFCSTCLDSLGALEVVEEDLLVDAARADEGLVQLLRVVRCLKTEHSILLRTLRLHDRYRCSKGFFICGTYHNDNASRAVDHAYKIETKNQTVTQHRKGARGQSQNTVSADGPSTYRPVHSEVINPGWKAHAQHDTRHP